MYVYYFTSAQHAVDNIKKRRVKVSFLDDLNDPFELIASPLDTPDRRKLAKNWKAYMNSISRVLCFSRSWDNPVLWSHYAERHRGICLGFKVPDHMPLAVSYERDRIDLQLEATFAQNGTVGGDAARQLLTTKFADWKYENEVRMFFHPDEMQQEGSLQFVGFGRDLVLNRVILGPLCPLREEEVRSAVHADDRPVTVISSRLAFKSYRVIPTRKPR